MAFTSVVFLIAIVAWFGAYPCQSQFLFGKRTPAPSVVLPPSWIPIELPPTYLLHADKVWFQGIGCAAMRRAIERDHWRVPGMVKSAVIRCTELIDQQHEVQLEIDEVNEKRWWYKRMVSMVLDAELYPMYQRLEQLKRSSQVINTMLFEFLQRCKERTGTNNPSVRPHRPNSQ
jgi:hypothetical protein